MIRLLFLLAVMIGASTLTAQDTFSIVAIDTITGEIGSAGATCLDSNTPGISEGALIISDIVLGVGAIHTQSFYDATNQANARIQMENGNTSLQIINWLIQNDVAVSPQSRQYGVVTLVGPDRAAAYTGSNSFDEKGHIVGPNYAIQGNILISEDVLTDMETAFNETQGDLATKLMAAMQGAKRPGADARCLSEGVSSLSAFLRVAKPTDTDASFGNLSIDINISETPFGVEPIDELQAAFDLLTSNTTVPTSSGASLKVFPNPSQQMARVSWADVQLDEIRVLDIYGRVLLWQTIEGQQLSIPTARLAAGTYQLVGYHAGVAKVQTRLVVGD